MKVQIKHKSEKSTQLTLNVPVSVKAKVDETRKWVSEHGVDFNATIAQMLVDFCDAIHAQMSNGSNGNLLPRSENHHPASRA